MALVDFLDTLQPEDHGAGGHLLEALKSEASNADLFWYPGSGRDLTPLLLDVPANPTGVRLFRPRGALIDGRPRVLWMNDYASPPDELSCGQGMDSEYEPEYGDIWTQYGGRARIHGDRECYESAAGIKVRLFLVTVWNDGEKAHDRGRDGDTYLVVFCPEESERILRNVLIAYEIRVAILALIKQGGLSGQRMRFQQYDHLPAMLMENRDAVGPLDYCCVDAYGQKDQLPEAEALASFRYVGGPIDWGWFPCRIFAREGLRYEREARPTEPEPGAGVGARVRTRGKPRRF